MSIDRVITVYDVIDEITQTSLWYRKRTKKTLTDSVSDEDVSTRAMFALFSRAPGRQTTVDHLHVAVQDLA